MLPLILSLMSFKHGEIQPLLLIRRIFSPLIQFLTESLELCEVLIRLVQLLLQLLCLLNQCSNIDLSLHGDIFSHIGDQVYHVLGRAAT